MSTGAIIVARLDSARLPRKVLAEVEGRPLLHYVLERVRRSELPFVVATSDREVDDPLAEYCRDENVPVFRGAATDVALRLLQCATAQGWDWFFRVNADSPYLDFSLIRQAHQRIESDDELEFVTNLSPRTFPYGVSVEAVRTSFYRRIYEQLQSRHEREHPTTYIYNHIEDIDHHAISREGSDSSEIHMTVDEPRDLELFEAVVERFSDRAWGEMPCQALVEAVVSISEKTE